MLQPLYMKIIGRMDAQIATVGTPGEIWQEFTPMIGFSITESILIGSRHLHDRNIVIRDYGLSRRQARIVLKEDQWFIEDLLSDNGTWRLMSGEPREFLKGPILITQDMIVLLGTIVVQFDLSVVEDEFPNLI